jgi:hypothetical protein
MDVCSNRYGLVHAMNFQVSLMKEEEDSAVAYGEIIMGKRELTSKS